MCYMFLLSFLHVDFAPDSFVFIRNTHSPDLRQKVNINSTARLRLKTFLRRHLRVVWGKHLTYFSAFYYILGVLPNGLSRRIRTFFLPLIEDRFAPNFHVAS